MFKKEKGNIRLWVHKDLAWEESHHSLEKRMYCQILWMSFFLWWQEYANLVLLNDQQYKRKINKTSHFQLYRFLADDMFLRSQCEHSLQKNSSPKPFFKWSSWVSKWSTCSKITWWIMHVIWWSIYQNLSFFAEISMNKNENNLILYICV